LAEPLARIPKQIRTYIANEAGDILFHPESGLALAHEFVDTTGLDDLFPSARTFVQGKSEALVVVPKVGSGEDTWYLQRVNFDPNTTGQKLIIALRAPYTLVSSAAHAALQHNVKVTICLVVVAIFLGMLLGRRLTTPLKQLNHAAARVQRGQHDVQLPIDQPGELGLLAKAFADMATEVQRREQGLAQLTVWLEQRIAERNAKLREQTDLLNLVVENIGEGVIAVDPTFHPCFINRAAQQNLGIDGSEASFNTWRKNRRFRRGDAVTSSADETSPLLRALHGESLDSLNLVVENLDGELELRLTTSARPLYDRTRQLRGAAITFRDITAQHEADFAQRLVAMVFEHSAQGVLVTNASPTILRVNKAFTDITGYSAEEAVGQTPKLLNAGMQSRSFYDRL
jgi:PAS domain-containing protein